MSLANVTCKPNTGFITANVDHIDGTALSLSIPPNRALIDPNGYIRFFSYTWPDGEVHGYLLHPYEKKTSILPESVSWTLEFLGGYGLARARGELVKALPKEMPRGRYETIQMASFFAFSSIGGYVITSFADTFLTKKQSLMGYHNIMTDKLIWTSPLRLSGY